MLTLMTGRDTATPNPSFFLRMVPRKSGIDIKGNSKKKWWMTARKNTVSKISDGVLGPSPQGAFPVQLREWNQGKEGT